MLQRGVFGCCASVCLVLCLPQVLSAKEKTPSQQPLSRQVEIQQVLTEIQKGLLAAQKEIVGLNMLPLKSVTLTLQADVTIDLNGKIKLFIFTFGKKWEKERSEELVLTLVPPSPIEAQPVSSAPMLAERLQAAIVDAARAVQGARDSKDFPLHLESMTAELSFVVTNDTSGGGSFEITPISADFGADLTKKAVQKITVAFENPEKKSL